MEKQNHEPTEITITFEPIERLKEPLLNKIRNIAIGNGCNMIRPQTGQKRITKLSMGTSLEYDVIIVALKGSYKRIKKTLKVLENSVDVPGTAYYSTIKDDGKGNFSVHLTEFTEHHRELMAKYI